MPRGKKQVEVRSFDEISAGLDAVIKAHETAAKAAQDECNRLEAVRCDIDLQIQQAYVTMVQHQAKADALRKA